MTGGLTNDNTALVVCCLLCLMKLLVMLFGLVLIQLNCAAPAKASPSPNPCDANTGNVSVFTSIVQFNLTSTRKMAQNSCEHS